MEATGDPKSLSYVIQRLSVAIIVDSMLRSRAMEATVCGHKSNIWVAGGCSRVGILYPIVVYSLIRKLNEEEVFTQDYSDDSSGLVCGNFENILRDIMRRTLKVVETWCRERVLKTITRARPT